jgi:hypothetical protein
MAGRFEAVVIIQQGFDNWDISQRDPTIRSEQNHLGVDLWVAAWVGSKTLGELRFSAERPAA